MGKYFQHKKLLKGLIFGLAAVVLGSAFFVVTACKNTAQKATLNFNSSLVAEINEKYDPQISVGKGTTIVSVKLYDGGGIELDLGDDYSFVPAALGEYRYVIITSTGGVEEKSIKTVAVNDTIAPKVISVPEEKIVELGVYSGFKTDLEAIKFEENNPAAVTRIDMKAVEISGTNGTDKDENGFDHYFFSAVGNYTVKVALTDLAGNTSYANYSVKVQDTVAPVVDVPELRFVWRDKDGKIAIPAANVYELADYDLDVKVAKGTENLTVDNNKVTAAVNDEITVTYTATDASNHVGTATTVLKVIEDGKLIEEDDKLNTLFTTQYGIAESDGGLAYIGDFAEDTLEWIDGTYEFGNMSEYGGVEFTLVNHSHAATELTVYAKANGVRICVGKVTLGAVSEEIAYAFDTTKLGLGVIDGWAFDIVCTGKPQFTIKGAELVKFEDPYFEVENLEGSYTVGSALDFGTITWKGEEISDYTITVDGVDYAAGERVELTKAGTIDVKFTVDVGSKKFEVTKQITVTTGKSVTLSGDFVSGTVGKEYTLPTAAASTGTLTTEVTVGNETVDASSGKFTPTKSGKYKVVYKIDSETVDTYYFAVEAENAIDFESANAFAFSRKYGDGFTANGNDKYVTSGLKSAKANIKAGSRAGVVLTNAYTLTKSAKYVTLDIYANIAGSVRVAFAFNGDTKLYISNSLDLERGANSVGFVIGASFEDEFKDKQLSSIIVYNDEKYDNLLFLDNIQFIGTLELDESIFVGEKEYTAYVGGEFIVPDIVNCDAKFIKSTVVTLTGGELEAEGITVTAGQILDLTDYKEDTYTLKYVVTDVFEQTHEKTVTVKTASQPLTAHVTLADLHGGDDFVMTDPELASETYTEEELKAATVNKYYRMKGGLEWIAYEDVFAAEESATYELCYTISVGDDKITLYDETYIHVAGVDFDFERHSAGDHLGYYQNRNRITVSDAWSHDGSYSIYVSNYGNYMDFLSYYAVPSDAPYHLAEPADALVFWAYAEKDITEQLWWADKDDGVWVGGSTALQGGEHKYTVKLDKTIQDIVRVGVEVPVGFRYWVDSMSFVKSADTSFPTLEHTYVSYEPIEFTRPTITNISKVAFSDEEIANIVYTLTLTDAEGKRNVYTFTGEKMPLTLTSGQYTAEFKIALGSFEYTNTQSFEVRSIQVEFIKPFSVFESGKETELTIAENYEDGVTFEAYWREEDGEWQSAAVTGDKTKVTLTGMGTFEIRYVAKKGTASEEVIYKVMIRAENAFLDFENYYDKDGKPQEHFDLGLDVGANIHITNDWSHDGEYSWYINSPENWISFFYFPKDDYNHGITESGRKLGGECNMFTAWIKSTVTLNNLQLCVYAFQSNGTKGWLYSQGVNIPANTEAFVTFTFDVSFVEIGQFGFETTSGRCYFYVDSVQYYNIKMPDAPDSVKVNETFTIDAPTVAGDAKITVSYRNEGASEYTVAQKVNDKYEIVFTEEGMGEILIEIEIGGAKITQTLKVKVIGTDPGVADMPWTKW